MDLILGKQRTTSMGRDVLDPEFETFPDELQELIADYLRQGGNLFASGCYVTTDLWRADAPESGRDFAREVLHCASDSLLATRAQTEALRGRIRVVAPHASFSRGEYRYFTTPRPMPTRSKRSIGCSPQARVPSR